MALDVRITPERFDEFRACYRDEPAQREKLDDLRRRETVTLIYAARDRERNNAAVLAELLRDG
jgi:uncharacterized protein YeaO (DUF488 family)